MHCGNDRCCNGFWAVCFIFPSSPIEFGLCDSSVLRKPEDSEITWEGKKKTARPEKPLRLKLNENGGSSGPSKIEGTMVFKKVPTSGTAVTFAFGKSGYRRLLLHFPSSTANSVSWLEKFFCGIWIDKANYVCKCIGMSSFHSHTVAVRPAWMTTRPLPYLLHLRCMVEDR